MTLRPSYKMLNETLEMEVAFVRWFGKGESLIRPKVTYAFTDKFQGIVGGEIYSGPRDSTFGRLKHASSAFAELRYNFYHRQGRWRTRDRRTICDQIVPLPAVRGGIP